jgi:tRNA(fMet)-specific endonuclease VapC
MTLRFLLDTNIVSEPLRPRPNSRVLKRLQQHRSEMAIPSVVWNELWFGCFRLPRSTKRETIETYLNEVVSLTMPILPYDLRAAEWHASERARLVAVGRPPVFVDGQIASIAAVNELTLVTHNSPDFSEFSKLSVTTWAS